jgi:hypothetical protein
MWGCCPRDHAVCVECLLLARRLRFFKLRPEEEELVEQVLQRDDDDEVGPRVPHRLGGRPRLPSSLTALASLRAVPCHPLQLRLCLRTAGGVGAALCPARFGLRSSDSAATHQLSLHLWCCAGQPV